MLEPRNFGTLTGGLVADPELRGSSSNVLSLRIAVDYAGKDSDNPENKSGYFRAVYFLNDDDSPNVRFVRDQVNKGNLKKGSQVQVIYRLMHNRRTVDGQRREDVDLIVEALTYAGSPNRSESDETSTTTTGTTKSATVPVEF